MHFFSLPSHHFFKSSISSILLLPHQNTHNKRIIKQMSNPQFWLLKTEAGEWSWEDQAANGGISQWDGVKNKQAQNNMKAMKEGDLCFFYHSGPKARQVVGVVVVIKEWYFSGEKDGAVDVRAVGEMRRPVDLKEMKGEDGLKDFVLFKQPRLSVVPVPERIWERVCEMGGGFEEAGEGDDC
ncbi:thymocyte nuclear-like protein [Tasmannia lanceolata]|uniref:thymocyte nuclear-like protein n=1 Tax=Tasmannia lanceolata TaxID=3420 RepID=UPI0040641663